MHILAPHDTSYKIPYDESNNYYGAFSSSIDIDNCYFWASLKLINSQLTGGNGIRYTFECCSTSARFNMSYNRFKSMLFKSKSITDLVFSGVFTFRQVGRSFTIQYLGSDPNAIPR